MSTNFRVIDTGVRDGRLQIAFDDALIDLHKEGRSPDTVRFLRFPPTALVGRHQATGHELMLDHIQANNIGVVRRMTGGGAIYLDERQVGWEIVLSRKRVPLPTLADYTASICEAVADGLSRAFGIDARFRPRNDIEVDGKKLSGTGGYFDGDTLIYQGTVLVDVDPATMMACLNVPSPKLAKRDMDKSEARVTTLKALIGRTPEIDKVHQAVLSGLQRKLGLSFTHEAPTPEEEALAAQRYDEEIGTDEFVYAIDNPRGEGVFEATITTAGGSVSAFVRLEGDGSARRVREVLLTGDFFVTPPRMVFDLEAHLRGVPTSEIAAAVDNFFETARPDLLTIAPKDFKNAIQTAVSAAS